MENSETQATDSRDTRDKLMPFQVTVGSSVAVNARSTARDSVLLDVWRRVTSFGRQWLFSLTRIPAIVWVVLDFCVGGYTTWCALNLNPIDFDKFGTDGVLKLCGVAATCQVLAGIALNLYAMKNIRSWSNSALKALGCSLISTTAVMALGYFAYYQVPGRRVTLTVVIVLFFAMLLLRVPFLIFRRYLRTRVLFIGTHQEVEHLNALLHIAGPHAYEPVCMLDAEKALDVTQHHSLSDLCNHLDVDEIVLPRSRELMSRWFPIAVHAIRHGTRLTSFPDLIEQETKAIPLDLIDATWLLGDGWDLRNHMAETVKRVFDIFLSLLGVVFCAPIYLGLALLIKLTSAGPIFYSQNRVGRFGVCFRIYKFRTMRVDAEKVGAQWASKNDPRVTWYGGLLRKSRLDETPQFFNILLGHMSFVGPRPERPEFVESLEQELPFFSCRHLVRPGLTGWAQINYRYGASVADSKRKLEYDLHYVRHLSLGLDIEIILRTVLAIAKGAR